MRGDLAATYQNMAGAYLALGDYERTAKCSAATLSRNSRNSTACSPRTKSSCTAWPTRYHRMANLQEQTKHLSRGATQCAGGDRLFNLSSDRYPKDIRKRLDWTFAQQRLGSILISMGDLKGALEAFEKALPIREQLRALDPHDARAQMNLANSHASDRAMCCWNWGRPAKLEHFEQQRKIDLELVSADPLGVSYLTAYLRRTRISDAWRSSWDSGITRARCCTTR